MNPPYEVVPAAKAAAAPLDISAEIEEQERGDLAAF
jgi:hypothetical protein